MERRGLGYAVYKLLIIWCILLCTYFFTAEIYAATEVIYQSDFSSDPNWNTDQPENFYWNETEGALFVRTLNRPSPDYSPSRHYYIETSLNPKLSYELSWDIKILSVTGGNTSGVAVFGLYGDKLYGFNPLNLNFPGNDQDGTFSFRLMTLDGSSRFIFTEVNPGFNYDIGEMTERTFLLGTWYTITERYDAFLHQYHFTIKEKENGNVLMTRIITADPAEPVNSELQNLGISMHPEGTGATNLALSTRIDGYTEYLIDNVTLTQIYDETYTEPSSVLFLPGIQSSRLYKRGLLGSEDQLWEPNINGDVAQLEMTEAGESVNDIYTRDIVDEALGIFDIYGSFIEYLNTIKSQGIISDWVPYAYDWRYSVTDVIENGTLYENESINAVNLVESLAKNNNSRVTIIAHSNGGLLAKALVVALESQGKAHLIDRIILIASPQTGTPKAVGSILHGYDQEHAWGIISDDETAREVIRNMSGAYGLVPSEAFPISSENPIIWFAPGSTTQQFIDTYGESIDSSSELVDFMIGERDGRDEANSINEVGKVDASMLNTALTLHRNELDAWIAPPHIQMIEIVGVGLDTVKGFEYQEFIKQTCVSGGAPGSVVCAYDPYYEPVPILSLYGDETVMADSAESYAGNKQTYYVNLDEVSNVRPDDTKRHADLATLPELQQFIGDILQNLSSAVPFIYGTKPTFDTEREVISVHSPVMLSVVDSVGNTVGQTLVNGYPTVVNNVPGSSYFEIGGATYIILPSTSNYSANISGQGEQGSYTLAVERLSGETNPTTIFSLVTATATPEMSATFSKSVGIYSEIKTDYDGNGTVDSTEQLVEEPTTSELFNALRTMVNGFTKLKQKERNWLLNSITKAETTGATKGYDSSAVLKIFSQIDAKLVQYASAGKITISEYNIFTGFVEEIKTNENVF